MKRTVITGFGIVSSIGNTKKDIIYSLKNGISGISFSQDMKKIGLRSNVWGDLKVNFASMIPKKFLRFMNDGSIYAFLSMKDAIQDSNLNSTIYAKNPRVGIIVGSGCGSPKSLKYKLYKKKNNKFFKKMSPYIVFKNMTSSISAILGTFFQIYGINYSVSSACSTSANCIGHATELISLGKQDIIFAGGSEELNWEIASQFDAIRVLSKKFNHIPKCASRAFDINRDGFVFSGGSGILVLEELNFALSRNAKIYAEIIGYGSTCDGMSVFYPSIDGAIRCMKIALGSFRDSIDYLNVHGTSTKIGDIQELKAIKKVFGLKNIPFISSTKSITGHSLGASGVQELIYSILMLHNNFIAPSINIENLDPFARDMNIVQKCIKKNISIIMSNSFGFGGTNVSLVIKKYK